MYFFWVFLIFVAPLALAQLPGLTSLPYYNYSAQAFSSIDTNNNSMLEPAENIASFNRLKRNRTDASVSREWFVQRLGGYGLSAPAATSMFNQCDRDGNGLLTTSDFSNMYTHYDVDRDNQVSREEFIRADNAILVQAYNNTVASG